MAASAGSINRLLPGGSSSERMTGIEPALSAWEADVLPLNYIRGKGNCHMGPLRRPVLSHLTGTGRLVARPSPIDRAASLGSGPGKPDPPAGR